MKMNLQSSQQETPVHQKDKQHPDFPIIETVPQGADESDNKESTEMNPDATTEFSLENIPLIVDDKLDQQDTTVYSKDPSAALLHWHYRLGHLPLIQTMAEQKVATPSITGWHGANKSSTKKSDSYIDHFCPGETAYPSTNSSHPYQVSSLMPLLCALTTAVHFG